MMCILLLASAAAALPTTAVSRAASTRVIAYKGGSFSAAVVPAASSSPSLPPLILLPPIGVGIDRTFCNRFVDSWAEGEGTESALHAIDVVGMGDSTPKPRMRRRLGGGWDVPPRTPREWAEQVLAYVRDEVREPCVVIGQSNLCAVALEAAARDEAGLVRAIVLVGPPAVEALSLNKPDDSIQKIWRIVGSPVGAALFRFARRKAFLASFSKKNLFADPSQVDEAYLDTCAAGAADAASRHAVFSFVAGTWRQDYRPLLASLTTPTLIISGRDVGAAAAEGGGVGQAPPSLPPPVAATEVDKTSFGGLLKWFSVWRGGRDQKAGTFAQVGRDLGLDPESKLVDWTAAMPAAAGAGAVETSLLPGWNVLVYESPAELASCIGGFVRRRFGGGGAPVASATAGLAGGGGGGVAAGLAGLLPVTPIKQQMWTLAAATRGGADADEAQAAEMERLVAQLEARSEERRVECGDPSASAERDGALTADEALDGEWDQVYCSNPKGGVVWSDGRTARRQLLGPLSGRVTQLVDSAAGSYKQRVELKLLGVPLLRAELDADIRPAAAADANAVAAWDVKFSRLTLRAGALLPLRARSAEGYAGCWTHTYLDEDTRVMRTRRLEGGGEWVYVLRRSASTR